MINGMIIIDKEKGFTSHDVVAKMRGICGQKKIGHTGTLDPMATGVLPICLGKGTGVCSILSESDKIYQGTMRLGIKTDTLDITGAILREEEILCSEEEIREAILSFIGKQDQIPPMYSALKINGEKLCDLARKGISIDRKSRKIEIYNIEILRIKLPEVEFEVSCSKGTYIRSLCDDIGEKLGCLGCLSRLRRIKAAGFSIDQALTLSQLQQRKEEGTLDEIIIPIDSVFLHLPKLIAKESCSKLLYNGNWLMDECIHEHSLPNDTEQFRIYDEEMQFAGIYEYSKQKNEYKPVKLFMVR